AGIGDRHVTLDEGLGGGEACVCHMWERLGYGDTPAGRWLRLLLGEGGRDRRREKGCGEGEAANQAHDVSPERRMSPGRLREAAHSSIRPGRVVLHDCASRYGFSVSTCSFTGG